jgi:short-subunit dehydrogenase
MQIKPGDTVLLTGASGGLGTFMAHAFADLKVKLVLVAHPGVGLEELQRTIESRGVKAVVIYSDLRDARQRRELLPQIKKELGPVDILVNNAGIEFTSKYHDLSEENICDVLKVNLEAPMILSRLLLPEMLERKRGHIVNISSLAGKSGPAFQEPYSASKAGLIAFTSSLRATYRGTGVGASVIIPGFVEAGIYANLKERTGCAAPALLGTSPPEAVARAVLRAIERDLPEVIVNPLPVRPLFAMTALFPSAGEWVVRKIGSNDFFKRVVEAQKRGQI